MALPCTLHSTTGTSGSEETWKKRKEWIIDLKLFQAGNGRNDCSFRREDWRSLGERGRPRGEGLLIGVGLDPTCGHARAAFAAGEQSL